MYKYYTQMNHGYKLLETTYNSNNILIFCITKLDDNINYDKVIKKFFNNKVDFIWYRIKYITKDIINYHKKILKNIINTQKYKKIILLGSEIGIQLSVMLSNYTLDDCIIYIQNINYINYIDGSASRSTKTTNKTTNKLKYYKKLFHKKMSIRDIRQIINNLIAIYNNYKIYKISSEHKISTSHIKNNLIISFAHPFTDNKTLSDMFNMDNIDIKKLKYNSDIIFFHDIYNSYYNKGLYGLSNSVDTTSYYINNIIKEYTNVIFIGYGIGGYAALLYGSILNITSVIVIYPIIDINTNIISVMNITDKYTKLQNFINNKTKYHIYINNDPNMYNKVYISYSNVIINYISRIKDIYDFLSSESIKQLYKYYFVS